MWATPTTGDCQPSYTFSRFKKFEINITIIYGQYYLQFPYTQYVAKFMSHYWYHVWFSGLVCLFVCCSNGYLIYLTLLFVCASTDFSYFYISISTSIPASFSPDILENLSQIRLSLFVSLGAEQIIFLAGIKATEKTVGGSLPFVEFV